MELVSFLLALTPFLLLAAYLYHANNAIATPSKEGERLRGTPWTKQEMKEAYERCEKERPDFKQYLPPKQDRRYIVFGGSGLVGGWMVEHLLMRGQDPTSVRVADLQPPRRELAVKHNVQHLKVDVTDRASVDKVFDTPWPAECAKLPLTVLDTVAYIHAGYRRPEFIGKYNAVNVTGISNVLEAAKAAAGCDVFIATSSASVTIRPINFFALPWQTHPDGYVQVSENAEPCSLDRLENFAGCYAYTKALGEKIVTDADNKKQRFRTGAIRPGHAIYGHGDQNPMSIVYDYLRRGGLATWIRPVHTQLVSAQNVSLAHLLYEQRLIEGRDIGGRAYAVCDPGKPITYGDMYDLVGTLAHPSTPIKFTDVPPLLLLVIGYINEQYILLQHKYLTFLPPVSHPDLSLLQPAVFNYSTINTIYDDSRARTELGYNPGHTTLEGLCLHMLEWNERAERKLKAESKVPDEASSLEKSVPVAPMGVAI